MRILLVGLSHKTAPVEIRERLSFTPTMLRSALTHFDTMHSQAHLQDVREGVILSTCNRLEVYALVRDPATATDSIINFLSQSCDLAPAVFRDHLYIYHDEQAVQHLFRVASGLESMVVGEPQILGQVSDAYQAALAQAAAGTVLSALFKAAIHAGKRVRTETGIGVNAVSVSSVAAGLITQQWPDLSERQLLLIGAGEMGVIVGQALMKRGVSNIMIANRTYEKAVDLARVWGGKAISFQQLSSGLAQADIVISASGAPHTILDKRLIKAVMAERGQKPLYLIDIAVPRDINADVAELPHVHLCDIDGLREQADQNAYDRAAEIPLVEGIVAAEVEKFLEWQASLEASSTIANLRTQIDHLRQQELERVFNRLELTDREQKLVATMSHRLVNKILHEPTIRLKRETASGNGVAYISTVRHLFALDQAAVTKQK